MPVGLLNGTTVSITGDTAIDGLTNGYKWQLDASRTVDWSLSGGFLSESWSNPTDMVSRINFMLSNISSYANIKFNYLGYFSNPLTANIAGSDINIAPDSHVVFGSNTSVWAIGNFPIPNSVDRGDIYINTDSLARYISYEPGSAGWFMLIHELGHTLGLKHPHDDGGTGRPTFSEIGWSNLDIDFMTIMSYDDDYNWNLRLYDPATPMVLDVIALQYLYGKNTTTNNTASTYVFNTSPMYLTVYDAGGIDLINQSSATQGWYVVLPNLQISTLVDTKVGFAMPMSDVNLISPTSLRWLMGDIENIRGSNFSDELYGNSLANRIDGGNGNDILDGGLGADTLIGGAGNDTYFVDNTRDTVTESTLSGIDEVKSTINYTLQSNIENLTLLGQTNLNGTGNTLTNTIVGNGGNNIINGGAGSDTLIGSFGNDTYILDNIGDLVIEFLNEGVDSVQSSVSVSGLLADDLIMALISRVENITLTGSSAINATGNDLNNIITGNSGVNTLRGEGGTDILTGGRGADTLTGGSGRDTFVFTTGDSGQTAVTLDRISDYTKGAVGTGDLIDYVSNLTVGGSAIVAISSQASINMTTGLATFASGSGTTLSDALLDIASRMTAASDARGEFALFQVNNTGDYYAFVSDGTRGIGSNDVLIQLVGVTSYSGIDLTGGNLTII